MIKEKLMKALKTAAADYNSGEYGADMAVACAAQAWDFNEKQAERLVEMFNTAAALNQEKSASDPTGSCELASKNNVLKILMDGSAKNEKAASAAIAPDYSFYGSVPDRTNASIEARRSGAESLVKAATAHDAPEPEELKVSQRSLYKIISGNIDLLKSAAAAADDVVRNARLDMERGYIKIAKAIEDPYADPELADMFKAACACPKVVESVSEYSTKVADSDGGRFAKVNVFDSSKVDDLLKVASEVENDMALIAEHEKKRDFYMSKAAEAEDEMLRAVGLKPQAREKGLADLFTGTVKKASPKESEEKPGPAAGDDAGLCVKIAKILKESSADPKIVAKLVEDLEKDAAFNFGFAIPFKSPGEVYDDLNKPSVGVDDEQMRVLNARRSVLLADLMTNDPIIRDADPNTVAEAYKTMVMSAPRVSLDKSQVRAFLRSAVNSVAISPSDAKVLGDVDKNTQWAMMDKLTRSDSSIKDSNV